MNGVSNVNSEVLLHIWDRFQQHGSGERRIRHRTERAQELPDRRVAVTSGGLMN
jgi:hypothetical protein